MTRLIIVLAVAAIATAITVKNTTQMSEQAALHIEQNRLIGAEVKPPNHLVKAFCAAEKTRARNEEKARRTRARKEANKRRQDQARMKRQAAAARRNRAR